MRNVYRVTFRDNETRKGRLVYVEAETLESAVRKADAGRPRESERPHSAKLVAENVWKPGKGQPKHWRGFEARIR